MFWMLYKGFFFLLLFSLKLSLSVTFYRKKSFQVIDMLVTYW